MIKRILFFSFFSICCITISFVFGQKPVVIKLDNPSFEDYPQVGHQPAGWFDCGFMGETPPDINPTNQFEVLKEAFHGNTYLGMVSRDNNTWEAIGQELKTPLMKDVVYAFSIYLARSETYKSQSRKTGENVNFDSPVIFQIWAGNLWCRKEELLGKTEPIKSKEWERFDFLFTPKSDYGYFILEAFYSDYPLKVYNGNILVDNASDIIPKKNN